MIKEIISYFFKRAGRSLLLVGAGLIFALTLGSLINPEAIAQFKAKTPIWQQIFFAESVGFALPGPRYIIYPVLVKLQDFGLDLGVIIALITGHVLIEPATFMIETGFFGIKFPLKRLLIAYVITFLAGIITFGLGL